MMKAMAVSILAGIFLSGCMFGTASVRTDPNETLLLLMQQQTLERIMLNNKTFADEAKNQSSKEDEIKSLRDQLRAITISYRDLRANINKTDNQQPPDLKKIPYPQETMSGDTTVFLLEEQ